VAVFSSPEQRCVADSIFSIHQFRLFRQNSRITARARRG
jgi:hypothetical protein